MSAADKLAALASIMWPTWVACLVVCLVIVLGIHWARVKRLALLSYRRAVLLLVILPVLLVEAVARECIRAWRNLAIRHLVKAYLHEWRGMWREDNEALRSHNETVA